MSIITKLPEPNIWEEICKDFAKKRAIAEGTRPLTPAKASTPQHPSTNGGVVPAQRITGSKHPTSTFSTSSTSTTPLSTPRSDYNPSRHNPVFCTGRLAAPVTNVDALVAPDNFDPATSHPAAVGYVFLEKPAPSLPPPPEPLPERDSCSPREYLENYVFPWLMPALEGMLHKAKLERCFERKRTAFNALDFVTEYLYSNNPNKENRAGTHLAEIPFVAEWWQDHPRAPLPLSLVWTEEEAAIQVQSHWRGYLSRKEPEISELRQWQREWREINQDARIRVNKFWAGKVPEETPDNSVENLAEAAPAV